MKHRPDRGAQPPEGPREVARFFAWTLALSVPFWLLDASGVQLLPMLPISALAALAPLGAALLMVRRRGQRPMAWSTWAQLIGPLAAPARAVVLALLLPMIVALGVWLLMRASGQVVPVPDWQWRLWVLLPVFLVGALAEESGWVGIATRGLQPAWGTLGAGLTIGAIWAVWHWVPLLNVGRDGAWIAAWSTGTVLQRVWMCQLFALGVRSVAWMAALHALGNLCWQAFPVDGSMWDPRYAIPIHIGIVCGLLLLGERRRFTTR